MSQWKAARQDEKGAEAGLRLVATFELIKGVFAMLVAAVLLIFLKGDLPTTVRHALDHLRMSPRAGLGRAAVHVATQLAALPSLALLGLAALYAAARGIEGYGLWHGRAWAEWFGIASGAVYVPFELATAVRHPTVVHVSLLALNILVVAYLAWHRWRSLRRVAAAPRFSTA
jgi:uncharacterized membrane protein (DUF2068 family)